MKTFTTAAAMTALMATGALAQNAPTVTPGGPVVSVKLSGQVNRGVLFADDGQDSEAFFVDNDNSSTRFRITGEGKLDNTTLGFNIEIEAESNSTASVSQINPNTDFGRGDFLNERKLELFISNPTFGTLTLGQGDTASNNTSEVDLSGTAVVGYSGIADQAGGILFRDAATGALTGINIGSTFTNLDGLSRQDRIRYDSPDFAGFSVAASAGTDFQDVAINYRNTLGSFEVGGALAYSINTNDDELVNGSLSVLHTNTGLSLTLAGGSVDRDLAGDLRDTTSGYVKLGYQTNALTQLGKSAFSVDYSTNDDVLAVGDQAESFGLQYVQQVDKLGADFYVGYRTYELDRPGASFDDIDTVLAGVRVRF